MPAAKKRPATKRKTPQQNTQRPRRREVWAIICLFLALFSFIGYFSTDAIFIKFFRNIVRGMLGWGFYFLPFALFGCAAILGFHRGRPVRLRVFCTLCLPVLIGAMLHLFLSRVEYQWSFSMIGELYKNGIADIVASGGAISGFVAIAFEALFSKIGTAIAFFVGIVFLSLTATDNTISGVVDYLRNREPLSYCEEDYIKKPETAPEPKTNPRKPVIDIPVDDPARPATKKSTYFNKERGVKTPAEVLTDGYNIAEPLKKLESEVLSKPELKPILKDTSSADISIMSATKETTVVPAAPGIQPELQMAEKSKADKGEIEAEKAQIAESIDKELSEAEKPKYIFPPVSLLSSRAGVAGDSREEIQLSAQRLEAAIRSFHINAHIGNITKGPSVTRYEVELEQGVPLNKLTARADDIAMALGASGVRIIPIADKISTVGIEVPNKITNIVYLKDIIDSPQFKSSESKTSFAIGKDIGGNNIVGNISKLPHLLIAGTTGSGKSVCMNSLILSILYKATPDQVRLIMVDPKMIELGVYNGIPHLLIPVVTDPKKAAGAIQWAVGEMMKRYKLFSEVGARDIFSYNAICNKDPERNAVPQVVILIDELADLMIVAAKEVEESICRVAQMGRAAGMHLVIATQRPSADVITGLMKANIPSRIAFAVDSAMNSRIILDTMGAEKLVGKGDMLYFPLGMGKPMRVQGTFVTDEEREQVIEFVKSSSSPDYSDEIIAQIENKMNDDQRKEKESGEKLQPDDGADELLPAAVEVILESGQASVSMLQRRLKLGYSRAARLVDQMEERGIVGPFEGSKPRQLLITKEQWKEMKLIQGTAPVEP